MGGISALTKRLAAFTVQARETVKMVDGMPAAMREAVDGMKDGAEEIERVYGRIGFRAGSSSRTQERAPGRAASSPASGPLIDRVGQQDIIDEIQSNAAFGKTIDAYVDLFAELLIKGSSITPARQRVIEKALYAQDIGARDIISKLTGSGGRKINFDQLEADIKKILKAQQDLARTSKSAAPKTSSGGVGRAKPQTCSTSDALSILLQSGALK